MKRRTALKQLLVAAAGAAVLPSCSFERSRTALAAKNVVIDDGQQELLAAVVDALIPATETPGAKDTGVHPFVLRMIDDCTDSKSQSDVVAGLGQLDTFSASRVGKKFTEAAAGQREAILIAITEKGSAAPDELKSAFKTIKQLAIRGFLSSEYVMVKVQHYEMVPGRFNGCIDTPKDKLAA